MTFNKILIKNIVQDKLDELSQKTIDSAARIRTAQLKDPKFKGEEVPIYKAGTGGTSKPVVIGKRRKPGKGVIQLRLQGREESPGKPAKKPLYKYITPGATGRAARQDASHQPVYDRMAELLIERNLFKDAYYVGKGAVGLAKLGGKALKGIYSGIKKVSPVIGKGLVKVGSGVAKAVKSAHDSVMKPSQDLTQSIARSTVKRNIQLDSELEREDALQKQARMKQKQDSVTAQKNATAENERVKNLNKLRSKVTRAPGQEDKRARKIAAMKALADREKALADREDEKSRKLVNYESVSYKDLMLQKIAEAILIERGVPQERIDELGPFVLAGLGYGAYRAWKGAKGLKDFVQTTKAGYDAYKTGGWKSALKTVGKVGGRKLLKQVPLVGDALDVYDLTQPAKDYATDYVKGYVSDAAKKSGLGTAYDKLKGNLSKVYKGYDIASKSKKKDKQEERPQSQPYNYTEPQSTKNSSYSKPGDDDDDQ